MKLGVRVVDCKAMLDQEFETYLTLLCSHLRLDESRKVAITHELFDHFEQRVESLKHSGLSVIEASDSALQEFGDATSLASLFNQAEQIRKRKSILRIVTSFSVTVIVFVCFSLAIKPDSRMETAMSFGIGPVELLLVIIAFTVASVFYFNGSSKWKGALATLACVSVASLITPADPASSVILGVLFFLFVYGGIRLERSRSVHVT